METAGRREPSAMSMTTIDAVVSALEKSLEINQTVNIGSDEEITTLQLAQLIVRLTGSRSEIVHGEPRAEGDMTRRQPDVSRMRRLLGRPLTTVENGVRVMIRA